MTRPSPWDQMKAAGAEGIALQGDIRDPSFCRLVVDETIDTWGRIDILVNNASVQYPQNDLSMIKEEQLVQTFSVNVFGMFYLKQAALKYMKKGSCIINTTSVTAFRGSGHQVDYAATKGAIVGFIRSLALQLAKKGGNIMA
ncbi:MAG: SDR family NAD(P)-dependent oxidoreductase [Leadbetterella sp.]|nr:SDR family NAD(P)-dependent oxidoreductase [Leadbetterella sp.]